MKTANDIDRALLVFRNRIDNLLIGEGSRLLPDGAFLLDTPAGPLRVAIDGNFINCHFASPLGGSWATNRLSDGDTGKWTYFCPRRAEFLTDPQIITDFASKLDRVRTFKPTNGERLKIEQDLRDQRRHVKRMAVLFAAIPDPDASQVCKPAGDKLIAAVDPAKAGSKSKTVKAEANAKRPAAKNAKPKGRGRVAKR